MIEPNFDLFLWCIFIFYGARGILSIIAGAVRPEKSGTYGTSDVIAGLIMLLVVFLVCVL